MKKLLSIIIIILVYNNLSLVAKQNSLENKMEINSKVIGTLEQHPEFDDWWEGYEIALPFFDNQKLTIAFVDFEPENDVTFIEEADQALENFLKLTAKDRNAISELVYKNCMDFLDLVEFNEDDEPLRQIKDKNEIWKFVKPTAIYVKRRHRRDKDVYIEISCNCDWEKEHGLQLVFRQGKKLTRISEQDGWLTEADAFDIPDKDDKLLSEF